MLQLRRIFPRVLQSTRRYSHRYVFTEIVVMDPDLMFMKKTNADLLRLKKNLSELEHCREKLQERMEETTKKMEALITITKCQEKELDKITQRLKEESDEDCAMEVKYECAKEEENDVCESKEQEQDCLEKLFNTVAKEIPCAEQTEAVCETNQADVCKEQEAAVCEQESEAVNSCTDVAASNEEASVEQIVSEVAKEVSCKEMEEEPACQAKEENICAKSDEKEEACQLAAKEESQPSVQSAGGERVLLVDKASSEEQCSGSTDSSGASAITEATANADIQEETCQQPSAQRAAERVILVDKTPSEEQCSGSTETAPQTGQQVVNMKSEEAAHADKKEEACQMAKGENQPSAQRTGERVLLIDKAASEEQCGGSTNSGASGATDTTDTTASSDTTEKSCNIKECIVLSSSTAENRANAAIESDKEFVMLSTKAPKDNVDITHEESSGKDKQMAGGDEQKCGELAANTADMEKAKERIILVSRHDDDSEGNTTPGGKSCGKDKPSGSGGSKDGPTTTESAPKEQKVPLKATSEDTNEKQSQKDDVKDVITLIAKPVDNKEEVYLNPEEEKSKDSNNVRIVLTDTSMQMEDAIGNSLMAVGQCNMAVGNVTANPGSNNRIDQDDIVMAKKLSEARTMSGGTKTGTGQGDSDNCASASCASSSEETCDESESDDGTLSELEECVELFKEELDFMSKKMEELRKLEEEACRAMIPPVTYSCPANGNAASKGSPAASAKSTPSGSGAAAAGSAKSAQAASSKAAESSMETEAESDDDTLSELEDTAETLMEELECMTKKLERRKKLEKEACGVKVEEVTYACPAKEKPSGKGCSAPSGSKAGSTPQSAAPKASQPAPPTKPPQAAPQKASQSAPPKAPPAAAPKASQPAATKTPQAAPQKAEATAAYANAVKAPTDDCEQGSIIPKPNPPVVRIRIPKQFPSPIPVYRTKKNAAAKPSSGLSDSNKKPRSIPNCNIGNVPKAGFTTSSAVFKASPSMEEEEGAVCKIEKKVKNTMKSDNSCVIESSADERKDTKEELNQEMAGAVESDTAAEDDSVNEKNIEAIVGADSSEEYAHVITLKFLDHTEIQVKGETLAPAGDSPLEVVQDTEGNIMEREVNLLEDLNESTVEIEEGETANNKTLVEDEQTQNTSMTIEENSNADIPQDTKENIMERNVINLNSVSVTNDKVKEEIPTTVVDLYDNAQRDVEVTSKDAIIVLILKDQSNAEETTGTESQETTKNSLVEVKSGEDFVEKRDSASTEATNTTQSLETPEYGEEGVEEEEVNLLEAVSEAEIEEEMETPLTKGESHIEVIEETQGNILERDVVVTNNLEDILPTEKKKSTTTPYIQEPTRREMIILRDLGEPVRETNMILPNSSSSATSPANKDALTNLNVENTVTTVAMEEDAVKNQQEMLLDEAREKDKRDILSLLEQPNEAIQTPAIDVSFSENNVISSNAVERDLTSESSPSLRSTDASNVTVLSEEAIDSEEENETPAIDMPFSESGDHEKIPSSNSVQSDLTSETTPVTGNIDVLDVTELSAEAVENVEHSKTPNIDASTPVLGSIDISEVIELLREEVEKMEHSETPDIDEPTPVLGSIDVSDVIELSQEEVDASTTNTEENSDTMPVLGSIDVSNIIELSEENSQPVEYSETTAVDAPSTNTVETSESTPILESSNVTDITDPPVEVTHFEYEYESPVVDIPPSETIAPSESIPIAASGNLTAAKPEQQSEASTTDKSPSSNESKIVSTPVLTNMNVSDITDLSGKAIQSDTKSESAVVNASSSNTVETHAPTSIFASVDVSNIDDLSEEVIHSEEEDETPATEASSSIDSSEQDNDLSHNQVNSNLTSVSAAVLASSDISAVKPKEQHVTSAVDVVESNLLSEGIPVVVSSDLSKIQPKEQFESPAVEKPSSDSSDNKSTMSKTVVESNLLSEGIPIIASSDLSNILTVPKENTSSQEQPARDYSRSSENVAAAMHLQEEQSESEAEKPSGEEIANNIQKLNSAMVYQQSVLVNEDNTIIQELITSQADGKQQTTILIQQFGARKEIPVDMINSAIESTVQNLKEMDTMPENILHLNVMNSKDITLSSQGTNKMHDVMDTMNSGSSSTIDNDIKVTNSKNEDDIVIEHYEVADSRSNSASNALHDESQVVDDKKKEDDDHVTSAATIAHDSSTNVIDRTAFKKTGVPVPLIKNKYALIRRYAPPHPSVKSNTRTSIVKKPSRTITTAITKTTTKK